ncbi:MAG: Flp pilus assembly protein CpaB [Chloroflexota bacterium]
MNKKRSPIVPIVLAVVIGLAVMALLNGMIRPVPVVVAKAAIAPGTRLDASLLEVRTVAASSLPVGAIQAIEEAEGQMLAVGRAPGDAITQATLGEDAQAGIPANLAPGHLAVAIRVDQASGLAGLLRPGQTVTLIGMLSPDVLEHTRAAIPAVAAYQPEAGPLGMVAGPTATPTPTPTPLPPAAPLARIAISGVKVLMVPQSFRYEEVAASSEEELFASARTVSAAQNGSVIVLDIPAAPVELIPGLLVNPAALIAALDEYGHITLALESAAGFDGGGNILTLNLADLYEALNDDRGKLGGQ